MRAPVKYIALLFTFLILLSPLLEKVLDKDKFFALNGAVVDVPDTQFSWEKWFNGSFQNEKEAFFKNSFGWRNGLIRMNNQLHYSCFRTIRANNVIEGKEGYLYQPVYIESYLGQDFIGQDTINENVRKLKAVQQAFEKIGKELLIVIAVSKGTYYPQYFPTHYDTIEKKRNNYEGYIESMTSAQLPFIDFNQHFLDIRDTTEAILYPKAGIHWSAYGEVLVIDSLLNYFSSILDKDLPDLKRAKEVKFPPNKRDKDLEKVMNLVFSHDNTMMTYTGIDFITKDKYMANVLFISDSFYWGLHNKAFTTKPFKEANFWYYNNSVWPWKKGINSTADLDFKEEIDKRDIVVIMGAEVSMTDFGYGVIDQLYETYVVSSADSLQSSQ